MRLEHVIMAAIAVIVILSIGSMCAPQEAHCSLQDDPCPTMKPCEVDKDCMISTRCLSMRCYDFARAGAPPDRKCL
jgi:hypothetical protein